MQSYAQCTALSACRNGVETQYIYDAAGNLLAQANGTGGITRYYIYGAGLAAMQAGGNYYVYHFDGTGHTVALTDKSNVVTHKYAYSPYGKVLGQVDVPSQPFKYAGQVGIFTESENLYYMRARYYDAEVGRFISEDPAGFIDGPNLYAYVGGNPIGLVDPSGMVTSQEIAAGIATLQIFNPDISKIRPKSVTMVNDLKGVFGGVKTGATYLDNSVVIRANDFGGSNTPLDPLQDALFLYTLAHEMLHVQQNPLEKAYTNLWPPAHDKIDDFAASIGNNQYRAFRTGINILSGDSQGGSYSQCP